MLPALDLKTVELHDAQDWMEDLPVSTRYDPCVGALVVGELEQPGHLGDATVCGASGQGIFEQCGSIRATDALDPDTAVVGETLLQPRGDQGSQAALKIKIVSVSPSSAARRITGAPTKLPFCSDPRAKIRIAFGHFCGSPLTRSSLVRVGSEGWDGGLLLPLFPILRLIRPLLLPPMLRLTRPRLSDKGAADAVVARSMDKSLMVVVIMIKN